MINGLFFQRGRVISEPGASMRIDGQDFDITLLEGGVNSSVFLGVAQQGGDEIAIKVSSKASTPPKGRPDLRRNYIQRYERFVREIEAMKLVKDSGKTEYVVELFEDGVVKIPIRNNQDKTVNEAEFPYFTMEYADETLGDFLSVTEDEFSLQQKILLFQGIVRCFEELHSLDIYHRDIKPANIFRFGTAWKIGDLGLISHRDEDENIIDKKHEKIGPLGRLSPEATNKVLGNSNIAEYSFDHLIDNSSDMYQLGLLFWYICQGEVPTGNIQLDDFYYHDEAPALFNDVVCPLLQYKKDRRGTLNLAIFEKVIDPLKKDLAL